MPRPEISKHEESILGFIAAFMDNLIATPMPNARGTTEENTWLTYSRLKMVFRQMGVAWSRDNCWTKPQLEEVVRQINWKIKMLDSVDPLAPKVAPLNPSVTQPSLPVARTVPAEDRAMPPGREAPLHLPLKLE